MEEQDQDYERMLFDKAMQEKQELNRLAHQK